MQCSFGSHKWLKTQKKNVKNVAFFKTTEKNDAFRTEKNAMLTLPKGMSCYEKITDERFLQKFKKF